MTREEIREKIIEAVAKFCGPPPADLSDQTRIPVINGLVAEIIFALGLKQNLVIFPKATLGQLVNDVERHLLDQEKQVYE